MSTEANMVVGITLKNFHEIHAEVEHIKGDCGNCKLLGSWFNAHPTLPVNLTNMIQAYAELAKRYPSGLADLPSLPAELSGEVQEVAVQ